MEWGWKEWSGQNADKIVKGKRVWGVMYQLKSVRNTAAVGRETDVDGSRYYWEQVLLGAGTTGSRYYWEQVLLGAGTTGSWYYWEQVLLGAGTTGSRYYWEQVLLGAGTTGSRYYWEQVLLGECRNKNIEVNSVT